MKYINSQLVIKNSDVTVRFKNESIEKKVTIIKVDKDTGNPVSAGAKLVLKDASW